MTLAEVIKPTPEIATGVKQAYNRLLKREREAGNYLDDVNISVREREKRIPVYQIEILNSLNNYLMLLKDWGNEATDDEIINGFRIGGDGIG